MTSTRRANIFVIGPSLKLGGIERASSSIANAFATQGHCITYLALFPQEHFFSLNSEVQFYEPVNGLNKRKLNVLRTVLWVREHIKRDKPDVVLVFNFFYGAIVRVAVIGSKIPIFVSDRASPKFKWIWYVNNFNKIVYSLFPPTGLIAQTNISAQKQIAFFKNRSKIKVIPNALMDIQLYPDNIRKRQILAVGRLNDHLKGFDRLLEAFAKIKDQYWQLVFVGDDKDGCHLKKQALELNVLSRVLFLGKVMDMSMVYAQAGIFVIPSRSEGFPNALCEAMAAGLPCISYDFIAGPRDIITDGHDGLIVENGNSDGMAAAIDYLIENPKERDRLGGNALSIRDRLKLDVIGKDYLTFIMDGIHE